MEQTLVLIKPDAVERNLIGEIVSTYEKNGLKVGKLKMLKASRELAEEHYIEHNSKEYYKELIDYITGGPLVAMVLYGEDAIKKVRKLNGKANPADSEVDTIRAKMGIDATRNSTHGSDSFASAEREINIWFSGE